MVTSIFNLSLILRGEETPTTSVHAARVVLIATKESVRGERAQEESKGALPPLIYLLFLAQTVHSKGDAPKSASHSQHRSHHSKKVAK